MKYRRRCFYALLCVLALNAHATTLSEYMKNLPRQGGTISANDTTIDETGTQTLAATYAQVQQFILSTSANITNLFSGCNSSSPFLRYDGTCSSATSTSGGTVTSVGLTAPLWECVANSPITGSGTLAISPCGSQTPNYFLATPNGTAGAVGLRAMALGDLPAIGTGYVLGNYSGVSAPPAPQAATILSTGNSGGVVGWTSPTTLGSSVTLPANELVAGGGAGSTPVPVAPNNTTTKQFLSETGTGSAPGTPAWGALAANDIASGIVLAQSGIPLILPSSGSVGANCAITGLTALPTTYANAYIWMSTNAVASGVPAGWYYFVASSTTAGTCYNNTYSTGTPTVPASPLAFSTTGNGAFTGANNADIIAGTVSIPGNTMGSNGRIEIKALWSFDSSSGNKDLNVFFGGTRLGLGYFTTGSTGSGFEESITNRGVTGSQVAGGQGFGDLLNGYAQKYLAVDTTSAQIVSLGLGMGTATDYEVLESFSIKLYPN